MAAKRGTWKTKYTPDYVVFDLETTGTVSYTHLI